MKKGPIQRFLRPDAPVHEAAAAAAVVVDTLLVADRIPGIAVGCHSHLEPTVAAVRMRGEEPVHSHWQVDDHSNCWHRPEAD